MKAIFAVNSINGFGTGNDMPWPRNRVDLNRFRRLTTGGTVIMGSGTWASDMPKPLPNRRNIVLSTRLEDSRCEVYTNITDMLMNIGEHEDAWVIGGANVLWKMRYIISEVHLTIFNDASTCSITLDTKKYLENFKLVNKETLDDHNYEIWQKSMI